MKTALIVNSALKDTVETWCVKRAHMREFTRVDMHDFIETMNYLTKKFMRCIVPPMSANEYSELAEVASDAMSLLTPGANLREEGITELRQVIARGFINAWEVNERDFYSGIMELSVHARTILLNGKIYGDGIDRTNA